MAVITRGASLLLHKHWKQWDILWACVLLVTRASTVDCASGCTKLICDVLKSFWKCYVFLELLKLSGHIHTAKSGSSSSKWHISVYVSVLYIISK